MPRSDYETNTSNRVMYLHQILLKLREDVKHCEENLEQAIAILKDLRETAFEGRVNFDQFHLPFSDTNVFLNKELIISFVRRYYGKKIPVDWARSKIEKEAVRIVSERGEPARFKEHLSSFLLEEESVKKINIFTMTSEDIKREFGNEKRYPDVEFIKLALEPSFRKKLRGVTSRESAIKRITDEVGKLRSVGRIMKE